MTKSLLPKAWNRTFVEKAPLVGFEKREILIKKGRLFDGCREELTGVTIPLKYLPYNKKEQGGNNELYRRERAVFVIS